MSMATSEVRHHKVMLSGVHLHYVTAGDPSAEPLLLVHGFPRSWFEWRHVIGPLAERYRVIAPDLRGSGDSSKPLGGFDKRTMSGDLVELLDHLGFGSVHVVGRDWGAPTALALALHWHRCKTLTFIENLVPGFGLEEAIQPIRPTSLDDPVFHWGGINHFTFHLMPDVAEMLIAGREREYFSWLLLRLAYDTGAIDAACIDECVRCLTQPGAVRATLGYSRAIYVDGEHNRAAVAADGPVQIPVLALGASESAGDRVRGSIEQVASDVTGDVVPACGHWVGDEQPEWLVARLLQFLTKHS